MEEAATPAPDSLAQALAQYVSADHTDPYLRSCADEAIALVTVHCGTLVDAIPASVLGRACLEVAASLYHHRTALAGVTGFEDTDISPVPTPAPRNPMLGAYPLLRPWLGVGIA